MVASVVTTNAGSHNQERILIKKETAKEGRNLSAVTITECIYK